VAELIQTVTRKAFCVLDRLRLTIRIIFSLSRYIYSASFSDLERYRMTIKMRSDVETEDTNVTQLTCPISRTYLLLQASGTGRAEGQGCRETADAGRRLADGDHRLRRRQGGHRRKRETERAAKCDEDSVERPSADDARGQRNAHIRGRQSTCPAWRTRSASGLRHGRRERGSPRRIFVHCRQSPLRRVAGDRRPQSDGAISRLSRPTFVRHCVRMAATGIRVLLRLVFHH